MSNTNTLPVAVIGAGPVGLAAAAHLIERGETPIIFERGDHVGANMRDWAHVRMFSPWEFTVDAASARLLTAHGWQHPPLSGLPTGGEMFSQYLQPLAELPEIAPHLHLGARVVAITRRGTDKMKDAGRESAPFSLHIEYSDGREAWLEARAVIDATGTWQTPNPIGSGGLPAVGEKRHSDHILYGIPSAARDRARFANQRVMVVGSGHSAINALLELAKLHADAPATRIYWAMRGSNMTRVYGGGDDDALPARARLGQTTRDLVDSGVVTLLSPFRISDISPAADGLSVTGETSDGLQSVRVDEIVAATGARPDLDMLRELRLDIDSSLESTRALAPMIDPNIHSCGTVRPHGEAELRHPEKDFYIVGMKSYGRAPTFLLATGYEQVRSVVAGLVGDWQSARDVQLNLPETGVCSSNLGGDGGACCGTTNSQPALLSLADIPLNNGLRRPVLLQANGGLLQPVALQTATRECGCDDSCCGDGVKSTTCGCDTTCCS